MAVGRYTTSTGNLQGLAARVSGANGTVGAAPQCIAHHGDTASDEVYNSVIRLANGNYAGQFAMIGTTSSVAWGDDVWLTRGNPCAIAAQTRIGTVVGTMPSAEAGFDLREVLAAPTPPTGRLAIAGSYLPPLGAARDAAFLQVVTATLLPVAGSGRLYGDHGALDEVFGSLSENPLFMGLPAGHMLAGYTEGPLDPRDLYLVHNDGASGGVCPLAWTPTAVTLNWPRTQLTSQRRSPPRSLQVQPLPSNLATAVLICN